MQVLFVTSEIAPIIKTGGLADVSAALPAALYKMGVDIRVLLPGYPQVLKALPQLQVAVDFFNYPPSGFSEIPPSRLLFDVLPNGVPLYVFDCPEMYLRGGGPYQDEFGHDWDDNAQRFGLFSKVAALMGSAETPLKWKPDVVHCNDWQSGLTPAYLQYLQLPAPCVMTVHNLAFQGIFPSSLMPELGLTWDCFRFDGVEFYGSLSFLKAGLSYSKHITTVSPSYAKEIQTKELGFGLQDLLDFRHESLTGILNGIDMDEWNPSADSNLVKNYSGDDLSGKLVNKLALQKRMGLKQDADIPLFGLVSRFANQKGLDLVLDIAEKLVSLPAQLVLLGSGDADLQSRALLLAHQHSGNIAAYIGFDEGLSHLIEAGADIFLMPSRFEPCGLNQMYSQRYGTPPVVHATGGLIDTVVDCNADTIEDGTASGFVFEEMDATTLLLTVQRAVTAYHNKKLWLALQKNCMQKDFSWKKSALSYLEIYTQLKSKLS
jgi:starch synthase